MRKAYIPERGDLAWLHFNHQAGHEQAGRRPAMVVSPKSYNEKAGLALFCPLTSQIKGYPFEVRLPEKLKTKGVVLCDQAKSLDWGARKAELIEQVPNEVVQEVLGKIIALLS